MTELTIDQALQQAIEAHKAGRVQEADRLYTAILKAQPRHPDANHNLGVLAVGVGKVAQALPFFKTALEANPGTGQFWLSYVDALIKLGRLAEARAVLDQAKSKGAKGDSFDQLQIRLNVPSGVSCDAEGPQQDQLQTVIDFYSHGQLEQALEQATILLQQFPNSSDLYNICGVTYKELGQLDASVVAYNKALAIKPDYAAAYYNMGNALKEQGKLEEAIKVYNQALAIKPDYSVAYINMGNALKEQGKLEEAIEAYNQALAIQPGNAKAYINMGVTLKEQGKLEEAIEAYGKSLAVKPDNAEAHNNMGIALKKQGKLEEAMEAYNRALAIKPDYAEAHNNIGVIMQERGKLEDAIEACNQALAIKLDYAEAYINMGNALQKQSKLKQAIEAFNKALTIKPGNAEAYNNMGTTLQEQGKLEEAIEAYNKALAIKPDYAEAYNNTGVTLQDQGKLKKAIEAYNKALAIKPDYVEAYNNMGATLQDNGKLDKAIESYNKALAIKSDFAEAHRNLSTLITYSTNMSQIGVVDDLLQYTNLSISDRSNLHYTYAKMKEDLGDLSVAFDNYVAGGQLKKQLLAYDFVQDQKLFMDIKNSASLFKEFAFNLSSEAIKHIPIFILGMPRSGTTLVEQIISSHTQVTGAGELNYVSRFGGKLAVGLVAPTMEALAIFRERYLAELAKRADGQAFVTDKMPQNFRFIALICSAFPEAKIVHVQRDIKATCWSNFKKYFASTGLGYSYDLRDTVKYYGLYKDLMHFWSQSYSDRIYNLDYDKLTEDQDSETRRLIDHLELNWEDACLAPQSNTRSVKTASQQQVRKKVYKGSSQAWRKYEPFLNGVFDELNA